MGGRGRNSGLVARQLDMNDMERQRTVADIIQNSNQLRAQLENMGVAEGGVPVLPEILKKCACCGEYTLPVNSTYEICPNCRWIDDAYQNNHPDSLDGKNRLSLLQARAAYQESKYINAGEVGK